MKNTFVLTLVGVLASATWAAAAVEPTPAYNTTITAIYGTGNPDTGWTAISGPNGLQLALRAKDRFTGSTANTLGVYSFANAPATRGLFNYEFSINSGSSVLDGAYDFYLSVDRDSSAGISYSTIAPLTYWNDNSYGDSTTANGFGVEGPASTLAAVSKIAQNSENITFGDYPGGALPLQDNATYNYQLYAVNDGAGANGARVASVGITVQVGAGGAPVPDSGSTLALLGLSFLGLVGVSFKKRALLA